MKIIWVVILCLACLLGPDLNTSSQDSPAPPWKTNVKETRKKAIEGRKPCVVILNVNAPAL